jgi:hypothetical protein
MGRTRTGATDRLVLHGPGRRTADPRSSDVHVLHIEILTQRFALSTDDSEIARVLMCVFGAFAANARGAPQLSLDAMRHGAGYRVRTSSGAIVECATLSNLVHVVDKDLTVAVQRRRPDLLFVHAAVLQAGVSAIALAGDSGSGKSTTAWGLSREGFGFLSDEFAPIDPRSSSVVPYPRALGLKRLPVGVELPRAALRLEHTIHVPVSELTRADLRNSRPLSSVFFVRHDPSAEVTEIAPLSAAETAARLYVLCLNALAHENAGLDAVTAIGATVRGYALRTASLGDTCARLRNFLQAR